MLILSVFTIITALAVNYNQVVHSLFLLRIGLLSFVLTGVITINSLYIQYIGSGMGIYSGLFQVTSVTQSVDLFMFIIGTLILLVWPVNINYYNDYNSNKNSNYSSLEKEIKLDRVGSIFTQINVISIENYPREYTLITLLSTLGASLLISASDLISLYLSIELQSFGVYILASIYRNSVEAISAGLKYFLLGSLSSCILLLGCSLIYTYTGLTHFDSLYSLISITDNSGVTEGLSLGIVLIISALFFKVGSAPFHNWSPDIYDQSPSIVTMWLTIMPKLSLLIFLIEFYTNIGILDYIYSLNIDVSNIYNIDQNTVIYYIKNLLLISSILSLIIGSTVGLSQIKIKRLLAYSTISHLGFMLLALAINTEQSLESFLFYLFQYTITNLNIFFILIALGLIINVIRNQSNKNKVNFKGNENDIQDINDLKGLFFKHPLISLSLSICLFSMAGVPPLIGFFSKQFVLYAAIQKGYYFISIVAILVSVISASYYLNVIKVLHLIDTDSKLTKFITKWEISSIHSYIISTLNLSILLFIIKPTLLLNSSTLLSLTLFKF